MLFLISSSKIFNVFIRVVYTSDLIISTHKKNPWGSSFLDKALETFFKTFHIICAKFGGAPSCINYLGELLLPKELEVQFSGK